MRIAPIPQQGGTQTIQQTINMSHNNPCGFNQFSVLSMGDTGITYGRFLSYLNQLLSIPTVIDAYASYVVALLEYDGATTEMNKKKAIYMLYAYGIAVKDGMADLPPITGYDFVCSIYEANGATILDSSISSQWPPVVETVPDVYDYTYLTLQAYKNPDYAICTVYNLLNQPNTSPWIDQSVGSQADLINSSYLVNQVATPESTMAIASLQTDTANTRNYGFTGFGFSSRPLSPENANASYNACYMNRISIGMRSINSIFVRLSLVQSIS